MNPPSPDQQPSLHQVSSSLPEQCPVLRDTQQLTSLSRDMVRALRRLKRDLRACKQCPGVEGCPVLASLNAQAQIAIQEVVDEWDRNRS